MIPLSVSKNNGANDVKVRDCGLISGTKTFSRRKIKTEISEMAEESNSSGTPLFTPMNFTCLNNLK